MSTKIRVPTTGNAGEDAVVLEWKVAVGTSVNVGDVVVVLETAKASVEVESSVAGTVLALKAEEGDEVAEHSVLLIVGDSGESVDESIDTDGAGETVPDEDTKTSPSASVTAAENAAPRGETDSPASGQSSSATESSLVKSASSHRGVSPRARVLAARNDVDPSTLTGSGPGGRIIVADVLAAKTTARNAASFADTSSHHARENAGGGAEEFTIAPVRGARKVTAQRMQQSLLESAQVTLTRYAGAEALVSFHARLRALTEPRGLTKVSINDLINFAVAQTLPDHPEANSTFSWEGIRQYRRVHLGVAVDTGSALLVPVVRNAESLSLWELTAANRSLIERARAGKITTEDMENGTFTVTNLGAFGVHWFTPVLNPPQSCILGVGAVHQSHPDASPQLPLSLTFDHRALDGARAAATLAGIARTIETIDVWAAMSPLDREKDSTHE